MNAGRLKAAVLISGSGSNLNALIQAIAAGTLALDIVRVISNRADAGGLIYARNADIPVSVIPHAQYADRDGHDRAIAAVLDEDRPGLIILAGYMRILSAAFVRRFSHRMINLHPSLLPLYKGLDTYNRAIAAGDQYTGASIHLVTADLDGGPVISQVQIRIEANDDATTLAARLGPLEHVLLVATVGLFCEGRLQVVPTASAGQEQAAAQVSFDGVELKAPLQLQSDGSLKRANAPNQCGVHGTN